MKCRRCDQPLRTLDTREETGGTVRRRRKCERGHLFVTVEQVVEDRTPERPSTTWAFSMGTPDA